MNRYSVEMHKGFGLDTTVIQIETVNKEVLDAVMQAVDQIHELWMTGRIGRGEIIEVRAV